VWSRADALPNKIRPGGWNRCILQVEDLAGLVATLHQHGARFRNDITDGPGGRQILCEDPSGNVVELFEAIEHRTVYPRQATRS
jgi:hypothetical protein